MKLHLLLFLKMIISLKPAHRLFSLKNVNFVHLHLKIKRTAVLNYRFLFIKIERDIFEIVLKKTLNEKLKFRKSLDILREYQLFIQFI